MVVRIKMDRSSMRSVDANLEKVYYNGRAAGAKGLTEFAKKIMAHSQMLVPVDTGALQASGYVEEARYGYSAVKTTFGYCGPDGRHAKINPETGVSTSAYVFVQHEALWYSHPRGGEAKFLEKPVREAMYDMIEYTGNTIRGALRSLSFRR